MVVRADSGLAIRWAASIFPRYSVIPVARKLWRHILDLMPPARARLASLRCTSRSSIGRSESLPEQPRTFRKGQFLLDPSEKDRCDPAVIVWVFSVSAESLLFARQPPRFLTLRFPYMTIVC